MEERNYSFWQAMKAHGFPLLFGFILADAGWLVLAVFIFVGGAPWVDWQLARGGVKTQGYVQSMEINHNYNVNKRHPMSIEYYFVLEDKNYQGVSLTFDRALIESAKKTSQVEIVYLSKDPNVHKIVGTDHSFFGFFNLIPFGLGLLGSLIFLWGLKNAWKHYQMIHTGSIVKGKITETRQNSLYRMNGRPQLILEYEFSTSTKEKFTNTFKTFDHQKYASLQQGMQVDVVYDEFFPEHNSLLTT